MDHNFLIDRLTFWVPLVLSLTVHEWAHAWTAWKLGDNTAYLRGRMTLNPLSHMDPIGTVMLPLMGVPFGWAKPVPFDPLRFRHKVSLRFGTLLVAIAGPISNIVIAVFALGIIAGMTMVQPDLLVGSVKHLLEILVILNIILAVFNMIPVQPLDGSKVADGIMPESLRPTWDSFCQLGMIPLVAVIFLPTFLGFSLFAWPMKITLQLIDAIRSLPQVM